MRENDQKAKSRLAKVVHSQTLQRRSTHKASVSTVGVEMWVGPTRVDWSRSGNGSSPMAGGYSAGGQQCAQGREGRECPRGGWRKDEGKKDEQKEGK
jgi:hypothetical protein